MASLPRGGAGITFGADFLSARSRLAKACFASLRCAHRPMLALPPPSPREGNAQRGFGWRRPSERGRRSLLARGKGIDVGGYVADGFGRGQNHGHGAHLSIEDVARVGAANAGLIVLHLPHRVPVVLSGEGRRVERLVAFAGGAMAGNAGGIADRAGGDIAFYRGGR